MSITRCINSHIDLFKLASPNGEWKIFYRTAENVTQVGEEPEKMHSQ